MPSAPYFVLFSTDSKSITSPFSVRAIDVAIIAGSSAWIFILFGLDAKLDTIEGNVSIKGQINSFTYSDTNDKESSILAKLFKWNN